MSETLLGPDGYRAASVHDNQEAHNWLHLYLEEVTPREDLEAIHAEEYATGKVILAEALPVRREILAAAEKRVEWNTASWKEKTRGARSVLYAAALKALIRAILVVNQDILAPDDFEMNPNDPLAETHRLLNRYLIEAWFEKPGWGFKPRTCPTGAQILKSKPELQTQVFCACVNRLYCSATAPGQPAVSKMRYALFNLRDQLLTRPLTFCREEMCAILSADTSRFNSSRWLLDFIKPIERHIAEQGGVYPELRGLLEKLKTRLGGFDDIEAQRGIERINEILGYLQAGLMAAGEPWADAALQEIAGLDATRQSLWKALLAHAQTADGGKPTGKWTAEAEKRLAELGADEFKSRIPNWFALTPLHPSQPFQDRNATFLKGLAWFCSLLDDVILARAVGTLAETACKKLPDGNARAIRTGNACIYALGVMPGLEPIAQLARLNLRVKHRQALSGIARALDAAAQKSGMLREDLAEITVPTYGLDADGVLRHTFDDLSAEMTLSGPNAREWRWRDSAGKPSKSIPAEVKRDHTEAWKELKQTGDEILKMLPVQRDRIERLLLSSRTWSCAVWLERYLDHPLLTPIVRRLIWRFQTGDRIQLGLWRDGQIADAMGHPLEGLTDETQVVLWHPVQSDTETVLQWRQWLESQEIVQPFKQAHREIYLLTDAEITTQTYSNRFAAHIIRQPQFHALCSQRGWQYNLQMIHDDHYDKRARLSLPARGLTAEFWTDPIGAEYETDTTAAGTWHYLSTDQVRFCSADARPQPLSEVPPQVFSEVMRDVDLFVAVASIAADPNWANRGADRALDQYWRSYSFGELSVSAFTRRDLLLRLLPRLKIASRCSLDGRFLTVRGDIRAYKIHLGSGNILMEPNDQYLCIVPDRRTATTGEADSVILPFEGDSTLAVILSKAFLLAEDTRITDPTITRQIGRKRQ